MGSQEPSQQRGLGAGGRQSWGPDFWVSLSSDPASLKQSPLEPRACGSLAGSSLGLREPSGRARSPLRPKVAYACLSLRAGAPASPSGLPLTQKKLLPRHLCFCHLWGLPWGTWLAVQAGACRPSPTSCLGLPALSCRLLPVTFSTFRALGRSWLLWPQRGLVWQHLDPRPRSLHWALWPC